MNKSVSSKIFDVSNYLVLLVVGTITFFPLYYVFCVSVTDPIEYVQSTLLSYPKKFTLDNYKYLLSTPLFSRAIANSAFLAVFGTACSLMVTAAFAYSLSRKRLFGRKQLLIAVVFTTIFSAGMIPNYLVVRNLGLINSTWALILPALSSGWNVLLLRSFFESIPESLEEAAIIDGCNDFSVFTKIILPLSLPAMATFGLFFAVDYWNTFFSAVLYINDFKKWPLQIVLQVLLIDSSTQSGGSPELSQQIQNPESLKMSAIIIATVPIMLVYPFLQKHFTKGVMLGSVKG
jgi:putative aldouronate transport system permease protein